MPESKFGIEIVPPNVEIFSEHLGTKSKFWYYIEEPNQKRRQVLFKYARPNTGEDWSEKLGAELGGLLGVSHAHIDLAEFKGKKGTISTSFVPRHGHLHHGNELLFGIDPAYPRAQLRGVHEHTVEAAGKALAKVASLRGWGEMSWSRAFTGILALDAWIGNTDRHHENWGVIELSDGSYLLAPSYDHASSLGRELQEEAVRERLATNDQNRTPEGYATRAKSAFYAASGSQKPISPIAALAEAKGLWPEDVRHWRGCIGDVSTEKFTSIVNQIPSSRIATCHREFVIRLLQRNKDEICRGRPSED
ncbi:MAG: hypothetical protein AB7S38_11245 [Vulcanimicrobiota bacterium]